MSIAPPKGLTAERARELLHYDRETGIFRWRVYRSHNARAGDVAGSIAPPGYLQISIDDHRYLGHQLAWLIETGEWPQAEIDHRDTDKANNRWSNLRLATKSQQRMNTGVQKNNVSGVRGVCWSQTKQKWRAYVTVAGRQFHVGYFDDISLAAAARRAKADELHGEFSRAA